MDNMKMGHFISELRKSSQMTQKQLAERLNITDKAVSKWERGQSYPDISLLTPLSEALGVTVGELLNGEKKEHDESDVDVTVDNALHYADKLIHTKRFSLHSVGAAAFSAVLLLGLLACAIVDLAMSGTFTWSLIPISSIVFSFAVFFPAVKAGALGVKWSLMAASVFTIPFLYILDRLIGAHVLILPIGVKVSAIAIVYCWVVFTLFKLFKARLLIAAAVSLLLLIPLNLTVNYVLYQLIGGALFDIWDMLAFLIVTAGAVTLAVTDRAKRRNRAK